MLSSVRWLHRQALLFPRSKRGGSKVLFRLPWCSFTLAALVVVAYLVPGSLAWFCFDRQAIGEGEWWRLITGHLVHSSPSHLLWDVLAFICIAAYVECYSRGVLLASIVAGALAVDTLLLSPWSTLDFYCGLSGLLFAPLTVALWQHWQSNRGIYSVAPVLACCAKVSWEIGTADGWLVTSGWPAYPEAHLAGIVGGLVCLFGYQVIFRNWYGR